MKPTIKALLLTATVLLPSQTPSLAQADINGLERQTAIWLEQMQSLPPEAQEFLANEKHHLTNDFTVYPPALLIPLQSLSTHFTEPGEAMGYIACMNEAQVKKNVMKTEQGQQNLKNMLDSVPPEYRDFTQEMADRSMNITLREQVTACACDNKHSWENILTPAHRDSFNKIAQGISLTAEDRKTLATEASSFTPLSSGYDPMECSLKAIGLYDEYLKIRGY
ncbi:hypothetical protein O4H49_04305 [Kiloniella laminariae]|uniref:Uncharacterized protein n=1 Tax=Kiloniella laminariae TaxID=454162 RepID=A0ABT4LJ19_9PROT|nr:hypothetical protein [Kiloniella laminariae]MCZ4279987.1 hypothetical protein [Kiloniella laminariae]